VNNRERTINYLMARPDVENVHEATTILGAFEQHELDKLPLTPKQRRRIQHKRAGGGAHRQSQRARRNAQVTKRLAHMNDLSVPIPR
jgi:hypothetical protein